MLNWIQARLYALISISFIVGCSPVERFCGGTRTRHTQTNAAENAKGNKMKGDANYPALTRADLSKKLKAGAITLVDANGSESYTEGHIPGALDFESLAANLPAGLPKDQSSPIVAYVNVG